ncbi:MAG: hypothetical protein H7A51_19130 [Akkermansiaceae bacterium]|nr:hypothetical protein [Akkermansiaceae bacterium]
MILRSFRHNILLLCLAATWVLSVPTHAQAILSPPFGLQWGDTPDKVMDWAEAKKLDVTIEMKGAKPELYIVRISSPNGSLPGHQAYALETRYHWGKLFEVTVHYGAPGMKPVKVKADFEKLKDLMTAKHGPFSPNNKQEKKQDGYVRRSVSYHVEPVKGLMLLLGLTEVEDTLRKKHSVRFSLLYRNQNIIPAGK